MGQTLLIPYFPVHQHWKKNSQVQPFNISPTESQFTPEMPYLEGSTQPDQTTDSVFIEQPSYLDSNSSQNSTTTNPVPPAPRSARSTKGAPPV